MTPAAADPAAAAPALTVRLVALLAVYFAVQAALRIAYAPSLGLDDAEMMVITQTLAVGYGSQPPLYNWLQIGAFALLGPGIPAFVILHFLLIFCTFVFVLLSARMVLGDEAGAAAATLALFTIPQFAWESQHSHTHTVLAVTLAAASLYLMLKALRDGRWPHFLALGAAMALGVLSKYNYAFFAAGLCLGAVSVPAFRRRILGLRMAAALLVACLLLLPHAAWVLTHPDETLARIAKFKIAPDGEAGIIATWAEGIAGMAEGLVNFAVLPLLVFTAIAFVPLVRRAGPPASDTGWPDAQRLVVRVAGISLGFVLIAVLATRATAVRDRWYQPILFDLPLILFILFRRHLTSPKVRALALLSIAFGIAAMVALVVVHVFPDLGRRPRPELSPYAAIAGRIRGLGFRDGYILAADKHMAGNLKLRFPESTVAEPEYGPWPTAGGPPRSLLVAWPGRKETPPEDLAMLWERLCGADAGAGAKPVSLAVPYERSGEAVFRMQVVVLPMCEAPVP